MRPVLLMYDVTSKKMFEWRSGSLPGSRQSILYTCYDLTQFYEQKLLKHRTYGYGIILCS